MSGLRSVLIPTLLLAAPLAGQAPSADEVRALLGDPVALIGRYQAWDALYRDGRGNSDTPDSGGLGWGESSFLRNYMSGYAATRDSYWLDKLVDHVDRMLGNQRLDARGYLAWDTRTYSVGIVKVVSAPEAGDLTLTPLEQREGDTKRNVNVTGHHYRVGLPTAETVRVVDVTADREVLTAPYPGALAIDLFAGATYPSLEEARRAGATAPLLLKGQGRAEAEFGIETTAPEAIQYAVHDGMVCYPIAQFIEFVYSDPQLSDYRPAADRYVEWFARHVFDKWERYWQQVDGESGAYTFTEHVTERFPGYLLPHNQYLALARAYLVLGSIDTLAQRGRYADRAAQMARYFQRHLRPGLDGRAYVWNYWDPPEGQEVRRYVEDHSHATIDVGFVCEAARRGVVFGPEDAVKLARTFTDQMGNGDEEQPAVATRVDGSGRFEHRTWFDWVLTGEFDAKALRFGVRLSRLGVDAGPQLCELAARLGAVTADDRRRAREQSLELAAGLASAREGNLSFEVGVGEQVLGWTVSDWSGGKGQGHLEWSTEAVDGRRSLALVGTDGAPNLVAEMPPLPVDRPTTFTITLAYKTAGAARPFLSLIADVPGSERQYDSSPVLAPSEEWREAVWEVTSRPGAREVRLYLRNGGVGTVWYDHLRLERREAR